MAILERFMAYAQDFERTFRDDDWSRLAQYFAPDARYDVRNAPFECALHGRDDILRGIRRSLDGFDRKFAKRRVGTPAPPFVEGEKLTVDWSVTYERPGAPALAFRGRSTARYAGDVIVHLVDTFDPSDTSTIMAWLDAHGADLDGSYT